MATPASTPTIPTRPGPATRQGVTLLIAILGAETAIGPLATDMYVPGFPAIGTSVRTGSSAIQLTMTAFLVGLVLGQLLIGPISDGIGRRRLLIAGALGFALCSGLCALAPTVHLLIAGRFLQGMAGAVGMVLARAIIADRFSGADIPRHNAVLAQILGIAPICAPVIGGVMLAQTGWRAIFVLLAGIGVLLTGAVLAKVPESLPVERRQKGGLAAPFRAMAALLANRPFMGYVLALGFSAAAMFTYIGASSFIFENLHGVSSGLYSVIFASNAIGMLIAGGLFGRLCRRVRMNHLLVAGMAIACLGAVAQLVVHALAGETLAGTWICLFVTMSGVGMVFPAAISLSQAVARDAPGAASALIGGSQFLFGALASPITGLFGTASSVPMAVTMLVAILAGMGLLAVLARPWEGHGEFIVLTPAAALE